MSTPDPPPGDRGFRQLARRVEAMDKYGTRALVRVAAQVDKIARDLAALKEAFEHQVERHEQRRRDRVTARRWLIGTCIAAVVALAVMVTLLLQILGRIR